MYGFGHSEDLVAGVLKERGSDGIVVATKAGSDFYGAGDAGDKGHGAIRPNYTKEYLISAAEKSLKRLGTDCLDILQLHSPHLELLERDDPWDALATLKRDGKIRHAGWSVQSFKETEQAHLLDLHADILDVIQVRYNLLEREAETGAVPQGDAARHRRHRAHPHPVRPARGQVHAREHLRRGRPPQHESQPGEAGEVSGGT